MLHYRIVYHSGQAQARFNMLHHFIQSVRACSAFAFAFTRCHWTRLVLIQCICSFSNRSAIYLTMKALWPLLCSWQSGVCIKLVFFTSVFTLLHFDLHSLNCQLCGFVSVCLATLFLELWKRHKAKHVCQWKVYDWCEEEVQHFVWQLTQKPTQKNCWTWVNFVFTGLLFCFFVCCMLCISVRARLPSLPY